MNTPHLKIVPLPKPPRISRAGKKRIAEAERLQTELASLGALRTQNPKILRLIQTDDLVRHHAFLFIVKKLSQFGVEDAAPIAGIIAAALKEGGLLSSPPAFCKRARN
jgi:hypothetical protein